MRVMGFTEARLPIKSAVQAQWLLVVIGWTDDNFIKLFKIFIVEMISLLGIAGTARFID